jgi:hypothetical protein
MSLKNPVTPPGIDPGTGFRQWPVCKDIFNKFITKNIRRYYFCLNCKIFFAIYFVFLSTPTLNIKFLRQYLSFSYRVLI